MGLSPQKYAQSFSTVELNFTFHDQTDATYDDQAVQYTQLGLRVIVKVSNYATHVDCLANPRVLWPWLKSKYRAFLDRGILLALLWQLPPSFDRTQEHLDRIGRLGAVIRNQRQGRSWLALHHAFEFRHSSWFEEDAEVAETLRRHGLVAVRSHLVNDTLWAGNLASGWHGAAGPLADVGGEEAPDNFVYLRCTGTSGRSVGRYGPAELASMLEQATSARSAIVVFAQGDVPAQALENARELKSALAGEKGIPHEGDEGAESSEKEVVSGTVVAITRGWNRRVLLDVEGGRQGALGFRHLQKKGLNLKVGDVLDGLIVEAADGDRLALSAPQLATPPPAAPTAATAA